MRRRSGVRRAAGVTALSLTSTALAAAIALAAPAQHATARASDRGGVPAQPIVGAGQSGSASGQNAAGTPQSPSGPATAPGQPDTTPGQTGTTPGQSGTTPGLTGTTPADGGTAPGQAGTTPGQAGTTPSYTAAPRGGAVTVVLPGSDQSVPLTAGMALPTGTVVDATRGSVQLPSPNGASPGLFKGGRFVVRQTGGAKPRTDLRLTGGSFAACPKPLRARPAAVTASTLVAQAASRRLGRHSVVRSLWGHDHHGSFSTSGRDAAAIVRGTTWLTQDRCDGTRVTVMQGAVAVRDLARHKTVLVRAGHSYLAKNA
jgi:hypothetical protein